MDAASPQVLEQLIAFAGDTAATDKVKDKPSVQNGSPVFLAGMWASSAAAPVQLTPFLLHVIMYDASCGLLHVWSPAMMSDHDETARQTWQVVLLQYNVSRHSWGSEDLVNLSLKSNYCKNACKVTVTSYQSHFLLAAWPAVDGL